jgi:hypothetical protein
LERAVTLLFPNVKYHHSSWPTTSKGIQSVFFLWFFVFRPGGTTKTYLEANSSGCWMKALKVDEKWSKWMIFWRQEFFFGSKFRQK